jgi:hypothetical protein
MYLRAREWQELGLTALSVNKALTTLSVIFDKQIALRTIPYNPVTLAGHMATGSNEVGKTTRSTLTLWG